MSTGYACWAVGESDARSPKESCGETTETSSVLGPRFAFQGFAVQNRISKTWACGGV